MGIFRASLADAIGVDAGITATLSAEEIVMNVPLGSMLFVDYSAGSKSSLRADVEVDDRPVGMPHHFYFGRIVSRSAHSDFYTFRMVCTLTRGTPGAPVVRTFSTRVGSVHDVRFIELPREIEAS